MRYELPHDKEERAEVLDKPFDERVEYMSYAVYELLLHRYAVNRKWRDVTNVTAQVDSGYIAERLVALFSGKSGLQNRGSGDPDLEDGSEVKSYSKLAADDRPRWNHNQFKNSDKKSRKEKVEDWLQVPEIFYLGTDDLNDYIARLRIWRINPQKDDAYRTLLRRWEEEQTNKEQKSDESSGTNFQLHHSSYPDSNVANNECGDLSLPLAFELIYEDGEIRMPTKDRYPGESEFVSDLDKYLN